MEGVKRDQPKIIESIFPMGDVQAPLEVLQENNNYLPCFGTAVLILR